jgi:hypothetical protein
MAAFSGKNDLRKLKSGLAEMAVSIIILIAACNMSRGKPLQTSQKKEAWDIRIPKSKRVSPRVT